MWMYDIESRKQLQDDPKSFIKKVGQDLVENVEVKVIKNSKEVVYFVMPAKTSIDSKGLENLSAAGTAGTASSLGTLSTVSTSLGTVSSATTAGSGA